MNPSLMFVAYRAAVWYNWALLSSGKHDLLLALGGKWEERDWSIQGQNQENKQESVGADIDQEVLYSVWGSVVYRF